MTDSSLTSGAPLPGQASLESLAWFTPIVVFSIMIVFNLAIVALIVSTIKPLSFKSMVREKTMPDPAQAVPIDPAIPATQPNADLSDDTSYSRVAGLVGTIVLACFVWALGNVVIVKAFTSPTDIPSILADTGTLVLSGSSLFAPYAFNQLFAVFKRNA